MGWLALSRVSMKIAQREILVTLLSFHGYILMFLNLVKEKTLILLVFNTMIRVYSLFLILFFVFKSIDFSI